MKFHNITKQDMLNGPGLRVVLWVSGCSHKCKNCHNPETWNPLHGLEFDDNAKKEIFDELDKDYIDGVTFTGGDPFFKSNYQPVINLCKEIKEKYPNKTIWVYTGYTIDEIRTHFKYLFPLQNIDVLIDGKYIEEKRYYPYPKWRGSWNQRIIDVQKSILMNEIVLHKDN